MVSESFLDKLQLSTCRSTPHKKWSHSECSTFVAVKTMTFTGTIRNLYGKYRAVPLRKRIIYTAIFVVWHLLLLIIAIYSNKLQRNLKPLAVRMDHFPCSWLILGVLIALVSIPPLFGHELLAIIAGYVYGGRNGFFVLTIASIIGESGVYFCIRYKLKDYLSSFRHKYHKNYGVFVAVVEDGGVVMLWLIRMSVIPPHFSTPFFSSLENITWWKWMIANICASPVKFFPPVFIGTLLRDKRNNSVIGDLTFAFSTIITIVVLWYIKRQFVLKKRVTKTRLPVTETDEKDLEQKRITPLPNEDEQSIDSRTAVAWSGCEKANDRKHMSMVSGRYSDQILITTERSHVYEMMSMPLDPTFPVTAVIRGSRAV